MKKSQIITYLIFLFLILLCGLNTYGWLFQRRFEGDIASRMLLVLGPHLKLGNPYKDLWEIIPPGYVILLQFWTKLAGSTPLHFVLLHFITLLASTPLLFAILKKLFSGLLFYLVLLPSALVLYSPAIHSMYISSEIFGVFFSLAALTSLYYIKNRNLKLCLSTALFLIAGQMKDPFLFGIFAVIPIFVWEFLYHSSFNHRKNLCISLVAGIISPLIFFVSYLTAIQALPSYLQVLENKTQFMKGINLVVFLKKMLEGYKYLGSIFQFLFTTVNVFLILILIGFSISIIFKRLTFKKRGEVIKFKINTKIKLSSFSLILTEKMFIYLSIIAYCLGSFLGMSLQGGFSTHYLIQGVIPLYIVLGLFVLALIQSITSVFSLSKKSFLLRIIIVCISLVILTPKPSFIRSYAYYWTNGGVDILPSPIQTITYFKNLPSLEDTDQEKVEKLIQERVDPSECILHAYGWHVASTYIYSNRKPCTRFFLANIVNKDWQKSEYRKMVLSHPPAAIIYGVGGSDINYINFENEVLPLTKIIIACYHKDENILWFNKIFPTLLYWPNDNLEQTKKCMLETLIKDH